MASRADSLAKRTPSHREGGKAVDATSLPLFEAPELQEAYAIRAELRHKLAHVRMEAHSRIRTQQKLHLIVAKIMRLEMKLGRPN